MEIEAEPGRSEIQSEATKLLATFLDPARAKDQEALARALVPQDEDFERAFLPEVAPRVRDAYRSTWPRPPVPRAHSGQTEVILTLAFPAQLGERNLVSDRFPGAYRRIVHLLDPDHLWVSWKFVRPGAVQGMAYDGLVRLDDHWAWIPKPWRLLPETGP